jgi:two-component system response regulator PilR (NtrC family)
LKELREYDFPGNVRELENILERAMALTTGGEICREDLQLAAKQPKDMAQMKSLPLQEYLDAVEKAAILEALEKTRFNKTAAAKLLGITFRALRYRLERLGMD